MKNAICRASAVLAAILCAGVSFAAETWHVDAGNFGTTGLDGRTKETAWGTLQEAHDNASSGDTVIVHEGVYDRGETYKAGHTNRLVVTKKLFFIAAGSRDATHIVGKTATKKSDGTAATDGRGADGMRCVCVTTDGHGSTFTGFVFRDGSSSDAGNDAYTASGQSSAGGGAVNVYGKDSGAYGVYFIDCVISNSVAGWGGAMYGGTAIRCLIANNSGSSFGGVCCSAGLWNSVVVGVKQLSSNRPACGNGCTIVNSTIAATSSAGYNRFGACYNTLFTSCAGTAMQNGYGSLEYHSCTNTANGVFSPATWDFRPVAGLEADGTGRTAYLTDVLTLPEDLEMTDFDGNPLDLTKEVCDIGAVQGALDAAGSVTLPTGTIVEGRQVPLHQATYARSPLWPKALVIKPTAEKFYAFTASGDACGGCQYRFLQRDGTYHLIPPPFPGQKMQLKNTTYAYEYWCDPDADASVATGTETAPFRTVQDAIVSATNAMAAASGAAVINLLPGDYREGGVYGNSHSNRFMIPPSKSILIRSTAGAAQTRIFGEYDENAPEACYAGCGPAAMRCALLRSQSSAVQGITFTDGHSNFADRSNDAQSDQCGGVYCGEGQVLDSVITNCTAVRGAAVYWGNFFRCRFYDNVSYSGVARYAFFSACYMDPSCINGDVASGTGFSRNSIFGSGMEGVLCTLPVTYNNADAVYSGLFLDQTVYPDVYGSVFRKATSVSGNPEYYAVCDPVYADSDNSDFRVFTGTRAAAASAAALGGRDSGAWGKWASNITAYAQSDIDGNRLKLIDGNLLPGCFHSTVDGVYVEAPKGGVSLGENPVAKLIVSGGLPVTVGMTAGDRPCIGVTVNGVTNRFDDGEISLSAADVAAAGGAIVAEAVYTTDWYVDPEGDDNDTGFTPKSAKKTLAAAMEMTDSGDTVHAAEGRYAEGYGSVKPSDAQPPSRVYMPSGRSLVADGDVSRTFIVGEIATDEFANELGCGSNSVRCVYMARDTLLKGFTLVEGRAYPSHPDINNDWGAPCNSAAVLGTARDLCIVQDCVISNCAAYNAAVGREVSFVNCLITGNRAKRGVTSECYHLGCVIDGNFADLATLHYHTRVVDTTIGPDARKLNGDPGVALGAKSMEAARVVNSLVLGKCTTGELKNTVSNCVFAAGVGTSESITNNSFNCRFADPEDLQVDGNLRPIAGKNVSCDMADASADVGLNEKLTGLYMALRARANNGSRLDAGALEADWRGRYAEDAGGMRFAVTGVDNAVEETAVRTVLLPEGTKLTGAWSGTAGRSRTYLVRFTVPEGGELSVRTGDGERLFAAGTHEYRFSSSAAEVPLEIASLSGTAEVLHGGWQRGTLMTVR